jgi:hypothetical protein
METTDHSSSGFLVVAMECYWFVVERLQGAKSSQMRKSSAPEMGLGGQDWWRVRWFRSGEFLAGCGWRDL